MPDFEARFAGSTLDSAVAERMQAHVIELISKRIDIVIPDPIIQSVSQRIVDHVVTTQSKNPETKARQILEILVNGLGNELHKGIPRSPAEPDLTTVMRHWGGVLANIAENIRDQVLPPSQQTVKH